MALTIRPWGHPHELFEIELFGHLTVIKQLTDV